MPEAAAQDIITDSRPADRQQLPLTFAGLGIAHEQEPIERPRGLPLHSWLQVISGAGQVNINGRQAVVEAGSGILIHADVPYAYHALTPSWTTHFILFAGSASLSILNTLNLDQSGVYAVSDPDKMISHFHKVDDLRQHMTFDQPRELSKALYAMLLDLSVNISTVTDYLPVLPSDPLRLVIQYIEDHYREPLTLDELAGLINIRKEYLCTRFKRLMGQTVFHFIQSIRIIHSRILLSQYPEKTVQEVAALCGFENTSYFCRVFRRFENTSPQKYRQHER